MITLAYKTAPRMPGLSSSLFFVLSRQTRCDHGLKDKLTRHSYATLTAHFKITRIFRALFAENDLEKAKTAISQNCFAPSLAVLSGPVSGARESKTSLAESICLPKSAGKFAVIEQNHELLRTSRSSCGFAFATKSRNPEGPASILLGLQPVRVTFT